MSLGRSEILLAVASFSRKQRVVFWLCSLIFVGALLLTIGELNRHFTVKVSARGGHIVEGIVGTPRFINPLLATSDADRDLSALIYSGLMRVGEAGQPIGDLAANYQVSSDGLNYTFTLKNGLTWHDGTPITSADIVFTIQKAQDPLVKSPRRAGWIGITVKAIDDQTVSFELGQAYPGFLENATLGILPKHLWQKFDAEAFSLNQFNSESVGSGPYQIRTIKKDNFGIPQYYELEPFSNFALGQPKISRLTTSFYSDQDKLLAAYRRGDIDSLSTVPAYLAAELESNGKQLTKMPLPRVFGVFFNQNHAPVLANIEVRKALDLAVNKQEIIDTVLHGYGKVAAGPIPFFPVLDKATGTETGKVKPSAEGLTLPESEGSGVNTNIEAARALLTKNNWDWNEKDLSWSKNSVMLALSLATADAPELKQAAEIIKRDWESLGVKVELKVFELGDLDQNIIRSRQYDAVFFGEVLGRNPDPHPFWHSKHRLDPGLNIALYTNTKVDQILEEIRTTNNQTELATLHQKFNRLVLADAPAIFVYYPYFLYVSPAEVADLKLVPINIAADRFLNIHRWYIKTDMVWEVFSNESNKLKTINLENIWWKSPPVPRDQLETATDVRPATIYSRNQPRLNRYRH